MKQTNNVTIGHYILGKSQISDLTSTQFSILNSSIQARHSEKEHLAKSNRELTS